MDARYERPSRGVYDLGNTPWHVGDERPSDKAPQKPQGLTRIRAAPIE
jgi:hypothetical protein